MNTRTTQANTKGGFLRDVFDLLRETAVEWWRDDTFRFAAALAFYTLFSLGPIVLVATGIASLVFVPGTAADSIESHVRQLAGDEAGRAVRQVIDAPVGTTRGLRAVIVGTVTFFLGASVVFGELQAALNRIWDLKPRKNKSVLVPLVLSRVRSFGIALAAGFLLVVSLMASAMIDALQGYALGGTWFAHAANGAASFIVVMALFATIYKYLPDARLAWRDVWVGALVTTVLFAAGKYCIGLYLGQTSIAASFGAAGSLAVLLVWVYYTALVSFFGAEFTQVHARWRGRKIKPEIHAKSAGKKNAPVR